MIYFIGAGPGAPDLITVRGAKLLARADLVIYAGSLVNAELLKSCSPDAKIEDSAGMTLEEVLAAMFAMPKEATVVRLHTGDASLYGAIREQMDALDALGLEYEVVPGVSSFCAAAAAVRAEYTQPEGSQTVIITRVAGRTPVPEKERLSRLAAHGASMVLFLSAGMQETVRKELMEGGYAPDTPVAVVYRASWPQEQVIRCTLATLPEAAGEINRQALILVGRFLNGNPARSKLYDPAFSHGYREAKA